MKTCTKCNETKNIDAFGKDKGKIDGLHRYCKLCNKLSSANWQKANRIKKNTKNRAWQEANKEKCNAIDLAWQKRKLATDPLYKLQRNLSRRIRRSLKVKNFSKKFRTYEIVGMIGQELYNHLVKGFVDFYSRYPNEFDVLHIDHIVPLSSANTEEGILRLNHYTNLRYLLKKDNEIKSDKLDWTP